MKQYYHQNGNKNFCFSFVCIIVILISASINSVTLKIESFLRSTLTFLQADSMKKTKHNRKQLQKLRAANVE